MDRTVDSAVCVCSGMRMPRDCGCTKEFTRENDHFRARSANEPLLIARRFDDMLKDTPAKIQLCIERSDRGRRERYAVLLMSIKRLPLTCEVMVHCWSFAVARGLLFILRRLHR